MTDSAFEPRSAEYQRRVLESFAKQQVMATLGASLVAVRPGAVELHLPYDPKWTQQHGFLHAGIAATVLDSACGYAAYSLMPDDAAVLTIEYKINLLAPAKGETFRASAQVRKAGRTITVSEGQLTAVSSGVEAMVGTIMTVTDRTGIEG